MLVIRCVLLFCICALLQDAESKKFEAFVGDIIDTWQFLSPTIIFKSDLPRMCMTHQWLLCYANDLDAQELANQLVLIHRGRKLDGLIIQGRHGHKKLLKHLMRVAPFILASNYPVFMPSSYKDDIEKFAYAYLDVKIPVTVKVHCVCVHVSQFLELHPGKGLGWWSEQAIEHLHSNFENFYARCKYYRNLDHPEYPNSFMKAIIAYDSLHEGDETAE